MPGGKPTKCNPERTEIVRTTILSGAPIEVAASHAGIAPSTHYDWCARGSASLDLAEHNLEAVPPNERPFAEYSETVERARREWELRQLALIQRAAVGQPWEKTKTTTEERIGRDGKPYTVTTTIVERGTTFQWTAAAWLLERRHPQVYGRVFRAEVSGPEGAPVELNLAQIEAEAVALVDEVSARRSRKKTA